MLEAALVVLAIAAIVVLRHYAARQVVRRRTNWIWLTSPMALLVPIWIGWTGVTELGSNPVVGIGSLVFAAGYGAVTVWLFRQMATAIRNTPPDGDIGLAITEPMINFQVGIIGVILAMAVIAVFVLIGLGIWIAANQ